MHPGIYRRLWIIAGVPCVFAALLAVIGFTYLQWRNREPRFHAFFDQQPIVLQPGWQAYGGTWEVRDGAMDNISDDRGAKLITGSPGWSDYQIEADVQLLSETGDAGFVIRTSGEEVGVDAYRGYFAGLRDLDDTLILGRADFGWHELRTVSMPSRISTRTWYHIKLMAVGCDIAAAATTAEGKTTVTSVHDPDCVKRGRFGLQSYSTGAAWRKLDVQPARRQDMNAMLMGDKPGLAYAPQVDYSNIPVSPPATNLEWYRQRFEPMRRELQENHANLNPMRIADLRLLAPNATPRVTIHGVVTLVSPVLFIQDSSGGIAIPSASTGIPLQIGDAVEANGAAELHSFSSILRNAKVRLLWSHTQVPAVAISASQGATGGFAADFVETEGQLTSIMVTKSGSVVLALEEGDQSFLAIAQRGSGTARMPSIQPGSRLRLRGICVTDKQFTNAQIPFAILMRTITDLQVLSPPPWWSTAHITELIFLLFTAVIAIVMLHASLQRSQLRAVLAERERLAMEMHDTLAQSFAGLGFQLEALADEAPPGSLMQEQLESTVGLVRFGHMQARRNISALRPMNIEHLGIAGALEETAKAILQGGRIALSLTVRGEPRALSLPISDALFRIAQEAISNAVSHGRPTSIRIRLHYSERSVTLMVHDNGKGFSATTESSGFGLRGMQLRAESMAAHFRVRSSPGHGTLVMVRARSPKRSYISFRILTDFLRNSVSHG